MQYKLTYHSQRDKMFILSNKKSIKKYTVRLFMKIGKTMLLRLKNPSLILACGFPELVAPLRLYSENSTFLSGHQNGHPT